MKIARNVTVSERYVEWYSPPPAPSLMELARPKGVTEGVSSDGSSGPMIYEPAHINSEIFELIRSSGYTPSVSHSLDSSLREGAGGLFPFNRVLANVRGYGRFSSPLRNSEDFGFYRSSGGVLLCCGKNLRRGAECGIVVATGGCRGNAIIWEEFG